MSKARIGLAAVVLCVALGVGVASRRAARPSDTTARAPAEPLQLDRLENQVDAALRLASVSLAAPASEVVDLDSLLQDMRSTLLGIISGDSDRYFDFRMESGASFKRQYAQGLLDQWRDRKIVSVRAPPQATDKELFAALWGSAPERRMSLRGILADQTRAGRGTVFVFGDRQEWPYSGAQFASSVFCPRAGPFSQDTGDRLDGTDRSAHVLLGVRLADGTPGYLRLNYFYDDAQRRWFPVTIVAGSDDPEYWPWPLF